MTKICFLRRTWTTSANIFCFYFKYIAMSCMFRIKVYDSFDSGKQSQWVLSAQSHCDAVLPSATHAVYMYIVAQLQCSVNTQVTLTCSLNTFMDYLLYLKLSILLGVHFTFEGTYKIYTYHAASMNEKLIACIGLLPTKTRQTSSHMSSHSPPVVTPCAWYYMSFIFTVAHNCRGKIQSNTGKSNKLTGKAKTLTATEVSSRLHISEWRDVIQARSDATSDFGKIIFMWKATWRTIVQLREMSAVVALQLRNSVTQDFEVEKYRRSNVVLKYGTRPILQNDNLRKSKNTIRNYSQ